jgi:hypothetical protein
MEVQRLGVKFFCGDDPGVDLPEFIPIFHRWIQANALDQLLIDVADYSHVPQGPGILLVAHEGIYAVDETGGRRGLVYYLRQATDGSVADRLTAVTRSALTVCQKLAGEPELRDRLQFRGEEMLVFANDRLNAPNHDETLRRLEPALTAFLATLYPDLECTIRREPDPKERFSVAVSAPRPVAIEALLGRLSGRD